MLSAKVRKPIKTYSRQRQQSTHDEPPAKRRRVEPTVEVPQTERTTGTSSPLPEIISTPERAVSAAPSSSPKAIFSDSLPQSTPPSSPLPRLPSPPARTRRPLFSILKRKPEPASLSRKAKNEPLAERSHNVQSPPKQQPKKKRLVQMQLDLGGDVEKTCKVCGMRYNPTDGGDAALHRKFHARNVGGIDLTKSFLDKLRKNHVWEGGDASFVAVISRKDSTSFRNQAVEILKIVNTELAAVSVSDEELWSQTSVRERLDAQTRDGNAGAKGARPTGDRFKVFLYIRGSKCVGACLAERIQEAYPVLDRDQVPADTGLHLAASEGSSISVGNKAEIAILGISRIWTSSLQRNRGIATRLLDSARSDFLYGMTLEKELVAFSQPTESGGRLARKWFGRAAGWLVYVD